MRTGQPLLELHAHGQSFWLDSLTRTMIQSGELARRLGEQGLRGVTSNPAIFRKAMIDDSVYEAELASLADEGIQDGVTAYEHMAVHDVQAACDVFAPMYVASGGADGFVSLEVSPHWAHDPIGTLDEARRLWRRVDRPNVLIKIPGTPSGVSAIEEALVDGINVNVTLLFSIEAYEAVVGAYLRALERRLASGAAPTVRSVASFFLSRIDSLVDTLLSHRAAAARRAGRLAQLERLKGAAAIANAKLAYQSLSRTLESSRWRRLADHGAAVQRLLWASTGTKNPRYDDVHYVDPLIGPHTISTMPERTAQAFAASGRPRPTVEEGLEEARRIMRQLEEHGIDFACVTAQLLNEGVEKFIEPFDALGESLGGRLAQSRQSVRR